MREELKERLIRHIRFFEEEIKDYALFREVSTGSVIIRIKVQGEMWRDG